jgi:hypothetical protein
VIFCGSIAPVRFPWTALAANGQVRRILNDYGKLDIWTRAVEWVVQDAGPSGSKGFEDTAGGIVTQRFRPHFRHSDYFYMLNYRQTWVPFLQGRPVNVSGGTDTGTFNWRFAIVRWLILLLLLAGAGYFGFAAWSKIRTPARSEFKSESPRIELPQPDRVVYFEGKSAIEALTNDLKGDELAELIAERFAANAYLKIGCRRGTDCFVRCL